MCSRRFGSFLARDQHILARTCKTRDFGEIDGINEYQKAQLANRDKPSRSVPERWERIWAIVFPKSGLTGGPFLETDCEGAISMIRDFWTNEGRKFVSQYIESHGLLQAGREDKKQAMARLGQLALKELLISTYEELLSTKADVGDWKNGNVEAGLGLD
jgi:hypothetical protein